MKKTLSTILIALFCLGLFTGCGIEVLDANSTATYDEGVINPLPEIIDVNSLDNCTVAVSLEKGDVKLSDDGKMVMNVTVYSYELYDMVDMAELSENDVILRQNKEVKVENIERLSSGLIRINGGEEKGGFDLISDDSTVYFEVGANDAKAYYEVGKAELPVSDEFEYVDASESDDAKIYYAEDLHADIEYNFSPNNTSIVIENGTVIKMNKVYTP